jgi:uncharacterized protein GlcG (DUF336 family)
MKISIIEGLEPRQLFQATPLPVDPLLSAADVEQILAQAASQAKPTQAIVVEDRGGNVLGEYDGAGLVVGPNMTQEEINEIRLDTALRARTASFFESEAEAFTTRTARFIIQDHFPNPIENTPGGPLYGVQFSSSAATDTIPIDPTVTLGSSPFTVTDPNTGNLLINELAPAGLSGDPGGIPLYIMGIDSTTGKKKPIPVGSIGVAGDFSDVAARKDLVLGNTLLPGSSIHEFQYAYAADPTGAFAMGAENPDFDESIAEAGATGFMAPHGIQATGVFVAGLRLPFLASPVAHKQPKQTLSALVQAGKGTEPLVFVASPAGVLPTVTLSTATVTDTHVRDTIANPSLPTGIGAPGGLGLNSGTPYTLPTVSPVVQGNGIPGTLVRRNTRADPTQETQNYGFVASNDTDPNTGLPAAQSLTVADVTSIIETAAARAATTRAGIRVPVGSNVVVYITVVDADGDLLGAFRMGDATNFSYDVAIQKARTAAFFSDDTHAFSDTAIGFISQRYFPIGINDGLEGPMYEVQNGLKFGDVGIVNGKVAPMDDTEKPLGEVTADITDPTTAVIPVSAINGNTFHAGQIVTFGTDPTFAARQAAATPGTFVGSANDTSNEYLITSVTPQGITVRSDGIDPSVNGILPLTAGDAIIPKNPLKNGITIFPGGFPLYKNGVMVGAIGVSGDGVTQDDIIAYSGTGALDPEGTGRATTFRPVNPNIESDALGADNIAQFIGSKLMSIEDTFNLGSAFTSNLSYADMVQQAEQRLEEGLPKDRLPYVKYPSHPNI